MKQKVAEKLRAIALRKSGYTINEITNQLQVAKSSVSVWVRNVPLSKTAELTLLKKIKKGQLAAAKSKRAHTKAVEKEYIDTFYKKYIKINLSKDVRLAILGAEPRG